MILLPQPPECWDYKHVLQSPGPKSSFKKFMAIDREKVSWGWSSVIQLWPVLHKALGSISNTTKSEGNKHIGYYIGSWHKSYFRVCCGGRAEDNSWELILSLSYGIWEQTQVIGSCVQALLLTKPSWWAYMVSLITWLEFYLFLKIPLCSCVLLISSSQ